MKKLLSLAVAAAMVLSCTAMAFAAENGEPTKSPAGKAGAFFREVVVLTAEEFGEDYMSEEQAQARLRAQRPDSYYREHCTLLLVNQAEDRAAFGALMGSFFEDLLFLLNGGRASDGSKGMEGKGTFPQEERL